jgi:hypothetical protein
LQPEFVISQSTKYWIDKDEVELDLLWIENADSNEETVLKAQHEPHVY